MRLRSSASRTCAPPRVTLRRRVEEGVGRLPQRVQPLVAPALLEVRGDAVERSTQGLHQPSFSTRSSSARSSGPYSVLPGQTKVHSARSSSSSSSAPSATALLGVADDQCAQQEGGHDVQRHDALVAADRHHRALAAVGAGGQRQPAAAAAKRAERPRSMTEYLSALRRDPAEELALAALGQRRDLAW